MFWCLMMLFVDVLLISLKALQVEVFARVGHKVRLYSDSIHLKHQARLGLLK